MLLKLEVRGTERLRSLRVFAHNLTGGPLSFDLPERCPNGLIDFEGLESGYDYYGTCAAGACIGWAAARVIELAPNQPRPIAEAHVDVDGRPPCTAALAPGSYLLRPIAPATSVRVCVEDAVLEVPTAIDEGARVVSDDPYWCRDSSECVLSCPEAPGCCGYACGCRHAINVHHRAAYEANYASSCARAPCPAVGCAYQPAMLAVCRNNRCVGSSSLLGDR